MELAHRWEARLRRGPARLPAYFSNRFWFFVCSWVCSLQFCVLVAFDASSSTSPGANRASVVAGARILCPELGERPRIILTFQVCNLLLAHPSACVGHPRAASLGPGLGCACSADRSIDIALAPTGGSLALDPALGRREETPTSTRLTSVPPVALSAVNKAIR